MEIPWKLYQGFLQYSGMDMHRALELFEMFAWDTTDKSYKDTIRYMSDPGQATAYMIGQLAIWTIRNETENALRENGIRFNEKEFHYQILSQVWKFTEPVLNWLNPFFTGDLYFLNIYSLRFVGTAPDKAYLDQNFCALSNSSFENF